MTIFGVDVSNHNGDVDWPRVAREGFQFMFAKATEGTGFRDATFESNVARARTVGLLPGAYHFLRDSGGADQARWFHTRVRAVGGPDGMLCACDNESDATWAVTRDFYATWNQLTGGHPLIMYSGRWWWEPRGWNGASLTPHLWHSHYVSGSSKVASTLYGWVPDGWWAPGYGGWARATLLQFTSSATVAGETMDANAYRGTIDELRLLAGRGADMDATQNQMLTAVRDGIFYGGPSCGATVPTTDGGTSNSLVAKLDRLLGVTGAPIRVTITDAQLELLADQVMARMVKLVAPQLSAQLELLRQLTGGDR